MEREGMGRLRNPASTISFEGAGAGLNTATSWPGEPSFRSLDSAGTVKCGMV